MARAGLFISFVSGLAACIGGAAAGWPFSGPLVVAVLLAGWSFKLRDPARQFGFITAIGVLGTALESGLIAAGVYLPQGMVADSRLCPLWITAAWVNLGLLWVIWQPGPGRRYLRLAGIGFLLGPAVFLLADDLLLGALHLRRPLWQTLLLLAILWQVLLPGLNWLSNSRWYQPRQ